MCLRAECVPLWDQLKKNLQVLLFLKSIEREAQRWGRNWRLFIEKKRKLLHLHRNVSQLYPLQTTLSLGIGWFKNTVIWLQQCLWFQQPVALTAALRFQRDNAFSLAPSYCQRLAQRWSPGCHLPLKHCSLVPTVASPASSHSM